MSQAWTLAHPERMRELNKRWVSEHRERRREIDRYCYSQHQDQQRERKRRWYSEHLGKAIGIRKRELEKLWQQTHPDKRRLSSKRNKAKRRGLYPVTFILNNPFPNSHLHHLTERIGVYIPSLLHRRISHNLRTGKGMVELNEVISGWL